MKKKPLACLSSVNNLLVDKSEKLPNSIWICFIRQGVYNVHYVGHFKELNLFRINFTFDACSIRWKYIYIYKKFKSKSWKNLVESGHAEIYIIHIGVNIAIWWFVSVFNMYYVTPFIVHFPDFF